MASTDSASTGWAAELARWDAVPGSWDEVDFDAPWQLSRFVVKASGDPERVHLLDPPVLDAALAAHPPPGPLTIRRYRDLTRLGPDWQPFVVWRSRERLGQVTLPHDDDYVLALVQLASSRQSGVALRLLRHDRELLDGTLWRIFEVEGGGEASVSLLGQAWPRLLLELASDGTIPRDRVLRSSLEALNQDFSAYRTGGFRWIYDAFEPTIDELAREQDLLLSLLTSPIRATASWAVKQATTLDTAGRLAEARFLALAGQATLGGKAVALATINLTQRIVQRRPDLLPNALLVVAHALGNPDVAVQQRAADVLVAWGSEDVVRERAEDLAPSARAALQLGQSVGPDAEPDGDLSYPCQLVPVAGPEDVARILPQALEGEADPIDIERVLAAVALSGLDEAVAASLAKRARAVLKSVWAPTRRAAAALILACVDATGTATQPFVSAWWTSGQGLDEGERDLPWPLSSRINEAIALAAAKVSGVVLWATPTDSRGRIDPMALVERARLNPEPTEADLAAALLRLGTDGRMLALEGARDLDGVAGATLRYALGGDPERVPKANIQQQQRIWTAAARARAPVGDDQLLLGAGLTAPGTGTVQRATVTRRSRSGGDRDQYHWYEFGIETETPDDLTSPLTIMRVRFGDLANARDALRCPQWSALIWPANPEPFASRLLVPLASFVAYEEVDHRLAPAMEGLRRVPGPMGVLSATCLALGLGVKDHSVRQQAIELFAEAIPDRLSVDDAVSAMQFVVPGVLAHRWATALGEAAGMSRSTAATVREVLTGTLPAIDRRQRRVGDLIRLLLDESLLAGVAACDADLREWLSGFTGSSAAAKTARQLLAIEGKA